VIDVLIADDEALLRGGVAAILGVQEDIRVVGEANDGHAAIEQARALKPHVVLMDIRMPEPDGIAATRTIVREQLAGRVIVLTTFGEDTVVWEALGAGASGFLLKTTPPPALVAAVRTVHGGDALLDQRVTRRLIEDFVRRPPPGGARSGPLNSLTAREREVLTLVARGQTNAEIARALFLSPATVKSHINRLFAKLGLRDRVQAVILGYETGLVDVGEAGSASP
jgi:DNA-binding NarL/FixJ family response regulator